MVASFKSGLGADSFDGSVVIRNNLAVGTNQVVTPNRSIILANDGGASPNISMAFVRSTSDWGEISFVPGGSQQGGIIIQNNRTSVGSSISFRTLATEVARMDMSGSLHISNNNTPGAIPVALSGAVLVSFGELWYAGYGGTYTRLAVS